MSEYLSTFRYGLENVYYLNKEGRERIGSTVIRKKTPQIGHYLLRNQLWIHLKQPYPWENEVKLIAGDVSVVCDAKFTTARGVPSFVEVDMSQPMVENQRKVQRYKKIQELTGEKFHLIWVTEIESRRAKLMEISKGLSAFVYSQREIM